MSVCIHTRSSEACNRNELTSVCQFSAVAIAPLFSADDNIDDDDDYDDDDGVGQPYAR